MPRWEVITWQQIDIILMIFFVANKDSMQVWIYNVCFVMCCLIYVHLEYLKGDL